MRLLLDTHVVLWWLTDDPTLTDELKDRIDEESEVYASPVMVWEIAIKQALGKLPGPVDLAEQVRDADLRELPVRHHHAVAAGRLPPIHRDLTGYRRPPPSVAAPSPRDRCRAREMRRVPVSRLPGHRDTPQTVSIARVSPPGGGPHGSSWRAP